MPGKHIEIPCLCVSVVYAHGIIQRKVVAGETASDHCGMGSEDCGHRKLGALYVKESGSCHPLMELGHHLVRRTQVELIETLDNLSGRIAEKS